jgi:hypothetical protein
MPVSTGPQQPPGARRRLVPAALALLALLTLAALASSGRPLGIGGGGSGPSAAFVDYGWTTVLIVFVVWVAASIWYAISERRRVGVPERSRSWLSLPLYVAFVSLLVSALYALHLRPLLPRTGGSGAPRQPHSGKLAHQPNGPTHTAHFRWEELVALTGALALLALYLRARRSSALRGLPDIRRRAASVSAALDEAVDDLRNEPDARRAIIAAYARTERALGAHGLPRRRAEAPLEYLGRTLRELDASATSISRLTDLFELAKFSHHELDAQLKDEAIDALVAVRDELREAA